MEDHIFTTNDKYSIVTVFASIITLTLEVQCDCLAGPDCMIEVRVTISYASNSRLG